MSDEARDAYLQRLDDCAKETDYEIRLEGRVAQLEEELKEERYAIEQYRRANEGLAVSKDKLEEHRNQLMTDNWEIAQQNTELQTENEALSELLSPLVDVELERDTLKSALDVAMSENQRLTKIVEDYEEENATLKDKLLAIECGDCGKSMLTCACDDTENG